MLARDSAREDAVIRSATHTRDPGSSSNKGFQDPKTSFHRLFALFFAPGSASRESQELLMMVAESPSSIEPGIYFMTRAQTSARVVMVGRKSPCAQLPVPRARNSSLHQIFHPTIGKCHRQQPPSEPLASLLPFQRAAVQLELQPHPPGYKEHAQKKAEAAEKLLSWAQSRIKAGRISQYDCEAQALFLHAHFKEASLAISSCSAREGRDHGHRSKPWGFTQLS